MNQGRKEFLLQYDVTNMSIHIALIPAAVLIKDDSKNPTATVLSLSHDYDDVLSSLSALNIKGR